ncbi:MAG: class I SAM-dependent methyltransferase [Candidatus Nanopelagicales bacterium]
MNGACPPPEQFVDLLACPVCHSELRYAPAPAGDGPGTYGILTCGNHSFPYLDGVAVLTGGTIDVHVQIGDSLIQRGPDVREVVARIRAGRGADALADLLTPPAPPPAWVARLPGGRRFHRRSGARERFRRRRRATTARLMVREDSTAQDWFEWFYRESDDDTELFNHFLCRFGQPRDLANLELTRVLPDGDDPVLDLAAGFGHLAHQLRSERSSRPVVCLDRNLFQLWAAKRFVAPGAWFVCSDADAALPLASDGFAGALCGDAFHLLHHKNAAVTELLRCAPDGPIVLARVGNVLVEPREGEELTPQGYFDLADGESVRIVDEDTLVDWYLRGIGPQFAAPADVHSLAGQKWLSLVIGARAARDHPPHDGMLHARGDLSVNPLYRDSGEGRVVFEFPSPWFRFENKRMAEYCAREAELPPGTGDIVVDVGVREGLARSFVLLSLPQRYLRGQRRCVAAP